ITGRNLIMEEQPKRIRSRGVEIIRALRIWLIASFGIFLTVLSVCVVKHSLPTEPEEWFKLLMVILLGGLLLTGCRYFILWLCRPGNKKRFAIGCGCFLLLLILFREEENWRGKRAWENFRREWEAKGERFDFKAFVPPAVPADRNFALAPVVASCYGNILDTNGNPICPRTTNVVNRLELRIYASGDPGVIEPTNGAWMKGTLTDLKDWQKYYQNLPATNENGALTDSFAVPPDPQTPAADVVRTKLVPIWDKKLLF
ncbi:MAG TPA: hypothetical protein VG347_09575, partial [Verrucomicrobiae bacterium]|nr:hypothetical protein [Verrucomicrobiae bacterium]